MSVKNSQQIKVSDNCLDKVKVADNRLDKAGHSSHSVEGQKRK
jgi:hypothetical protein